MRLNAPSIALSISASSTSTDTFTLLPSRASTVDFTGRRSYLLAGNARSAGFSAGCLHWIVMFVTVSQHSSGTHQPRRLRFRVELVRPHLDTQQETTPA